MLFSLAEIKKILSNRKFSKVSTNQNRALIIRKFFIFSDINKSESSFNSHGIFNKFIVSQSELSSTFHEFFNNYDIVCSY